MIRIILGGMKFAIFVVITLVVSQIPVGKQRICDHVRDIVQHGSVQKPVSWIAQRFNFLAGISAGTKAGQTLESRRAGSENDGSDKDRLSGLFKRSER